MKSISTFDNIHKIDIDNNIDTDNNIFENSNKECSLRCLYDEVK